MKKHLAALAATAAVVGGTIVITPAAQAADTPGCVSQKEFRQVKKRMTITKVHSIFDTKGKRDHPRLRPEDRDAFLQRLHAVRLRLDHVHQQQARHQVRGVLIRHTTWGSVFRCPTFAKANESVTRRQ